MKYFLNLINIVLILIIISLLIVISSFIYYGRDLPDFNVLKSYEPPVVSKIFASDGNFLEEYSKENRVYTSFEKIPTKLIDAFIVTEDRNFYSHTGFDLKGIFRASLKNMLNIFQNKRPQGASTITQQVAKNILLSNEVSISRKIKEIILSMRIEKVMSKEKIMELYLNEIYLGNRSYGITAASINYFNKSLNELNLEEMAMLAALPKAPSTYNPYRNPIKAMKRRNWVINRLFKEDFINRDEFEIATNKEIDLRKKNNLFNKKASYFKEAVRREIIKQYDETKLYAEGLSIMSTLNTKYQNIAEEVFRKGIQDYDKKFKWRKPFTNLKSVDNWKDSLARISKPEGLYENELGLVLNVKNNFIKVGLKNGNTIKLNKDDMAILNKSMKENLSVTFKRGDVLILSTKESKKGNIYKLSQIPDVNGGMIVVENSSGRILAMVGGYDSSSEFNRVTQAYRQPGSAFKPIVYLAALENNITPVSKILDAPVVIKNPTDKKNWRPTNYGNKFYGESTLRLGIEKSRNLMTVRLAQKIGLNEIKELSEEFKIYDELPLLLSSSLGSVETSLQKLSIAYAIIANGGFSIEPTLIDKIQDKNGKVIYRHDKRKCKNCLLEKNEFSNEKLKNYDFLPNIEETRKRIVSEESAYQMTSLLMGVLERGTAKNINYLDFQVAGKTGTTNNNQDAWFIGYNSEITVGVYVGYDSPSTLGQGQTGSNVAAPIFGEFMKKIYKEKKPKPFSVPQGIKFINVDVKTGAPSDKNFVQEAFKNNFSFEKQIQNNKNTDNEEFLGFY